MHHRKINEDMLQARYSRSKSESIIFVDESYQSSNDWAKKSHYLMTGVVVRQDEMEYMRKEMQGIVGGSYWHSTESFQTPNGRETFASLIDFIALGEEPLIVTMRKDIPADDQDMEKSRAECLIRLAQEVSIFVPPVSMMVLEQRHEGWLRGLDSKHISSGKSSGLIPRNFDMCQTSPSYEPLLWLPDTVAFALHRKITRGEKEHVKPIEEAIKIVPV